MLVLVTYDVNVTSEDGQRRLRHIANICLDHGMRVQNSVFECEVDPAKFVDLKNLLMQAFNPKKDSLRFYFLGKKGKQKVEHLGVKAIVDPLRDALIL